MTQLLLQTIAHFAGASFMLKANNQPYKNILGLPFSCVNIVKYCKILTFKVNFYVKNNPNLSKKKFH